jgi:hypothetical protein
MGMVGITDRLVPCPTFDGEVGAGDEQLTGPACIGESEGRYRAGMGLLLGDFDGLVDVKFARLAIGADAAEVVEANLGKVIRPSSGRFYWRQDERKTTCGYYRRGNL